jgi:hypothetical protein
MDHSGRLWLDDHAWMNSDGVWYDVVRSPVFITDKSDAGPNYVWDFPKVVFESSDGRLWFRSMNGMVSLNPEKGEWCWFTTEQSNIVEDSDHNLWMVADNKLYKLELEHRVTEKTEGTETQFSAFILFIGSVVLFAHKYHEPIRHARTYFGHAIIPFDLKVSLFI